MGKIQYSPEAVNDLRNIHAYIFVDLASPIAAQNTVKKIRKQVQSLSRFPDIGERLDAHVSVKTDYRKLVCGNYIVFYRVESNNVHVVRVIYGGRNYMRILFGDTAAEDEKDIWTRADTSI